MSNIRSVASSLVFDVVLYAPYVGALGLDMARKCTKEDALCADLEINSPVPQYPEARAYYVCEIKKGIEYVVSH